MPSLTGQGGYGVNNYRKFDGVRFKLAGIVTNKEQANIHKKALKDKGYNVRMVKRTGAPYQYKYSLWVRR